MAYEKFSLKELKDIMQYRGTEGREYINFKYKNVNELCRLLSTSPTDGLCDSNDIERRRILFGKNVYRFNSCDKHTATVVRCSQKSQIAEEEVVVGDICLVTDGDEIMADGILLESNSLLVESSLTGDTDLVKKANDGDPMLLSGTHVISGNGKFVVIAVGANTRTGIIMQSVCL